LKNVKKLLTLLVAFFCLKIHNGLKKSLKNPEGIIFWMAHAKFSRHIRTIKMSLLYVSLILITQRYISISVLQTFFCYSFVKVTTEHVGKYSI
jgi:hypothetical protein